MEGNKWGLDKCPFCGGMEFRVTTREVLEELYERKGEGSMTISCKNKNCGCVMYQKPKEVSPTTMDYDERLRLLVDKWNERVAW